MSSDKSPRAIAVATRTDWPSGRVTETVVRQAIRTPASTDATAPMPSHSRLRSAWFRLASWLRVSETPMFSLSWVKALS